MVKRWHEPISPPKRHCRSRPLVALWLRVTQIVFHHADEGAAQVLVWDVFRTDPGEIGGRLEQAIAHAAGAGSERVHRVGQFLKGVEGLSHCRLLRSARWPPPRRLSASPGTPYTAADASVRRASAHRNPCTVDAHAFAMLRTLGLPLKRVGGNSRHAGRSNAFERRGPRAACEAVRNCPRRRRGRVSLSSILGSCSCAEFPGANRADPFRLGLGPGRAW